MKDLCGLGRDLTKVVIIDNLVESFGFQPFNGIFIPSYYGDPEDRELETMMDFLEILEQEEDVRFAVEKYYRDL